MTEFCNRFVKARDDYDIIFQTQCKFSITANPHHRPYFIFTDLTQQLTEQVWPNWSVRSTKNERARWLRLETEAFHRATKIFTFNDHVKASFIQDYGLDKNKIVVVGSGMNSAHWAEVDIASKRDREFALFFLCTEFERQGGPSILKAFEIVRRNIPHVKLIIGGNSPVKSSEHIEVHKNPSNSEIEAMFNRARVYLSPGHLGGVQSVLEAMGKKCVCVVSENNFLLYDIINNESTGVTVPLNDAHALAEKIIELRQNPDRAETIAMAGYEHARANFSWDTVVKKMSRHFSPKNQVA
jgi:glycosyltransferase involved in cell wall biosynthesis